MSYFFIGFGALLVLGAVLYGFFGPPEDVYDDPDGLVIPPFNGEGMRSVGLWLVGIAGGFLLFLGLIGLLCT